MTWMLPDTDDAVLDVRPQTMPSRLALRTAVLTWFAQRRFEPVAERHTSPAAYAEWQRAAALEFVALYRRYLPTAPARILDLGCGNGGETGGLADLAFPGATVVGVDVRTVPIVRSGVARTAARFAGADIARLPFADGTFDLVLSRDGMEHFRNVPAVLAEAQRVLRPGGLFASEFAPYPTAWGHHLGAYVRVPWAHLLFGQRAVLATAARVGAGLSGKARGDLGWALENAAQWLNGITIHAWERLLRRQTGWRMVAYRVLATRRRHAPLTRVPGVRELVGSTVTILQRAPGARLRRWHFRPAGLPAVVYGR